MAGGMDLGTTRGRRAKKPLDAPINLVPFIDLMAVTISFLIMTAVWTQVGRLQVAQAEGPAQEDSTHPVPDPVIILVTRTELILRDGSRNYPPIPLEGIGGSGVDLSKLVSALTALRGSAPEQHRVTLRVEDQVRYDLLVQVIDECIGAGLPDVTVEAALG